MRTMTAAQPKSYEIGEREAVHEALTLTQGAATARIVHLGQVYTLRITRQGKLILTK